MSSVRVQPMQVKMKKFSWSYSALLDYENCPFAYAHKRVYKTVIETETAERKLGNDRHKEAELYLKGEVKTKDKTILSHANRILELAEGKLLLVENQLACTKDWAASDWFGKDAWGRCILDAAIIAGDTAWMYDWKTGKVAHDQTQAMICSVFLGIKYPALQKFNFEYIWLKNNSTTDFGGTLMRQDIRPVLQSLRVRLDRMETAWNKLEFPKRKSGLCKEHCEVHSCEHCGKRPTSDVW